MSLKKVLYEKAEKDTTIIIRKLGLSVLRESSSSRLVKEDFVSPLIGTKEVGKVVRATEFNINI